MKIIFWLVLATMTAASSLPGQTLLSQNQPVIASSFQAGNYAANGNDGSLATRWTASGPGYPQTWQVDLGATNFLRQAIIYWYTNTTPRSYQYQLFTSLDGTNFNLLVDATSNAVEGVTIDDLSGPARYVQVVVTGSSYSGAYASFFECQVFGAPAPYAADTNTLVLLHLDEAAGSAVTTNTGTLGGQACSVSEATATTTPPTVTDVLGYGSVSGFGNASQYGAGELIGWDANNNGAYDGDNGSTPSGDQITMAFLNMGNGGQTPWTLEAVIQPTVTNVNQEIISTDSSSANRGFQFRLNQSGQLELNLIAPGIDIQTPIPSSGFHAFVPGNWYHVAAAYDGTNVVLYWTKMDPSVSAANAISTNAASVGASFGLVQGPLTIGNENRAAAGEYFRGRIDEVRLSSIARAPDQMLFGLDPVAAPTASVATTAIAPSPTVYAGTTATLSATVSGVSATAFAWQSDGGSGGMVWTNLSGSVTNSYSLDTTGIAAGAYQFRLIVFAANGSLTNNPATLTVLAASGPVLVSDTVVTPANATAGSTVSVSAAFAGTLPMAYQWYFIPPSGVTNAVAGATSTTLTIPNVQTNEAGNYFLVASNNPPGLGSQVAASSPASLTLAASYFKESTGMFCDLLEHPEETTITASTPTFGWYYPVSCRNDYQTGYRLIVASSQTLADAGAGDLWDSGVVSSSNSINVAYHGTALQPNTSYFWRVQTLNRFGQTNAFSAVQQFNTGSALSDPLARPGAVYQQPGAGSANVYPLRYVAVSPVVVTNTGAGTWFIDFGRDAFGFATVHLAGNYSGTTVGFGLGEAASGYNVNTSPGATIRYWSGSYALKNGDFIYTNRSTTAVGAISPPVGTFGIVSPFRYLQLTGVPAGVTLTAADLTQWRLETEFDPGAAAFSSSSPVLNQVWDLCHYSMEALTFDGIYVDGDRERTPYEADSYIHQLCAYGADNDFTMARCSFEYLTNHLTWPTEWPMHMIFIAWADYQHTGDPYLITKYYGFLTNKCLYLANARPNGLLWSYPQTGNNHTTNPSDIIDWYRVSGDGIGNVDGYVAEGTNAVINAFYYRCLTLMSQMAQVTGHAADATNFNSLAAQVYTNYNSAFWNAGSQSYVDGIGTTHSSADANFYPLAFGLVPTNQQAAVVNYLHSRIAALGAMPAGVYGAQYFLEGLLKAGDADVAIGLMATNNNRSWMKMINLGCTITAEAWSTADKSNEDWNHAWGAAPGNLIPRYLLGVRPLSPGGGRILVQPQLGSALSFVQGTVPTIRGTISVLVTNVSGQTQLLVDIPGNVTATVVLPSTNAVAILDGAVVSGTVGVDSLGNSWLTLTNIGSGRHALWTSATNAPGLDTLYNNWSASWFGTNASNPALAGPAADPDGDGFSNYNEFIAGTNPLDRTDYFHITGVDYVPGATMTATVNGRGGRRYILERTLSLAPPVWSEIATQAAAADFESIRLQDPLPPAAEAYFWVMVAYP